MNTWDFVHSCGCDIEFVTQKAKELDKFIDDEAVKRAKEKEDQLFNAHKEEYQLEVLKQFQEEGIKKEGAELSSSSPLISEKYTVDGIYAMMTRSLGNYQEQILKNAVKSMLYDMKKNPDITIFDILQYIVQYNEEGEPYLDEAHKKLRCKLQAVLDELEDTPQNKNSWGEFLKEQGKPIVVISTGADSVGKGSEIIDIMLESLYTYKQCHPCEKYSVIIDEAQDLYLHEKGTVNVLLRKGGKHNITRSVLESLSI